jgi:prevent-host-death family protein
MRNIRTNEDVVPAKEFKAKLSAWLQHVARNRRPVLITLNGKPAGVLLDPRDFDEAQDRARFVESVQKGLEDANAGRFVSEEELDAALNAAINKGRK